MLKKLISILLVVSIFLLSSCADKDFTNDVQEESSVEPKPLTTSKMTMGTGSTYGTYYGYGDVLGRYITNYAGINVTVVSTDGSMSNIQGITEGNYQLVTVPSDIMTYAWEGTRSFEQVGKIQSFRAVAGLYAETIQLVTMDPEIKSVSDLKGRSVSIGVQGSALYFNAIDVLKAAGLTEDDIRAQHQSFADSADALVNGKIDAVFFVASAPLPAITELCTNYNACLVPIDGEVAEKLIADCPFYSVYNVPANTYEGQTEDVKTVAVKATLIVSADVDEEAVYKLTKAIFDNSDAIAKEHVKGKELSIENATNGIVVPFHKGAARYYSENKLNN